MRRASNWGISSGVVAGDGVAPFQEQAADCLVDRIGGFESGAEAKEEGAGWGEEFFDEAVLDGVVRSRIWRG